MSHAAMSCWVTGRPNCAPSAAIADTVAAVRIAAPTTNRSSKHILGLPGRLDLPAGDRVVMKVPAQPSLGHELRAAWLRHAAVVGGAALQHRRTAVPLPGGAEAGERLRQHRLLQHRGCKA